MTEAEGAPAPKGRPRPDSTVERDEKVFKFIEANPAQTRAQIATGTELPGNEVYLSLYRLSRANPPRIVKSGAKWSAAGTSEQPAEVVAA